MNHIEQIKELLPKAYGWCSVEKATKLAEFIISHKPEVCVEIGVFGGSSLIPQALSLKQNQKGIVYGIDPWTTDAALEEMKDQTNLEWWQKVKIETIYQSCVDLIKIYGVDSFVKLIRDKSENVVNSWEDNTIDLLHIDGNHSEALSYKDAVLYLPKVKSGGIIFFDDIYWAENHIVTTRKALNFLLEHCDRIDVVTDCLILKKK